MPIYQLGHDKLTSALPADPGPKSPAHLPTRLQREGLSAPHPAGYLEPPGLKSLQPAEVRETLILQQHAVELRLLSSRRQ